MKKNNKISSSSSSKVQISNSTQNSSPIASKKKKKAGTLSVKKATKAQSFPKLISKDTLPSNLKSTKKDIYFEDNSFSDDEDYDDNNEERNEEYRIGGYHRVIPGEIIQGRYIAIEKLGWGHFSTVWLAFDKKSLDEANVTSFVALKIQKSALHYREAAYDEIEMLKAVINTSKSDKVLKDYGLSVYHPHVIELLDSFEMRGANGRHVCMTFNVLDENLLDVIKKYQYRGIPISIVRKFAKQILQGIDFLHRHCCIIHTDIKPENILIVRRNSKPKVSFEKIEELVKTTNESNNFTVKDIENQVAEGKMSPEQRRKMKKRLKKKKQRSSKKANLRRSGAPSRKKSIMEKLLNSGIHKDSSCSLEADLAELHLDGGYESQEEFPSEVNDRESRFDDTKESYTIPYHKSDEDDESKNLTTIFPGNMIIATNFMIINDSTYDIEDDREIIDSYGQLRIIDIDDYVAPPEKFYGCISMVISYDRLVTGLLLPDVLEDLAYSVWHIEYDNFDSTDSTIRFVIRGQGFDDSLMQTMNAEVGFESSCLDKDYNDIVVWDIIHDVNDTENILSYLEKKIPSLSFFCIHDPITSEVSECKGDDYSTNVMKVIDSIANRYEFPLVVCRDIYLDNQDDFIGDDSNIERHGYLIGIDFESNPRSCNSKDTLPNKYPIHERIIFSLISSRDILRYIESIRNQNSSLRWETKQDNLNMDYESCNVVIADLGNACWTNKHFTDEIQTRQYRSPESVLGCLDYDTSTDIWSIGCMIFELLTGDFLFDPQPGKSWDRDEDHLALMLELLGIHSFPHTYFSGNSKCQFYEKYFKRNGKLRNIQDLRYWSLKDVLHEKYKFHINDADEISEFLLQMLEVSYCNHFHELL